MMKEQVHDTYSLLVGLHIMLASSWGYKRVSQSWRRYQRRARRSSQASLEALKWSRADISQTLKRIVGLVLTTFNAGLLLPLLLGANMHLYILAPFESTTANKPQLSLTMDWAYGLLLCSLACSLGAVLGWYSPAAWLLLVSHSSLRLLLRLT